MLRHVSPYLQHVVTINTPLCFSICPKCFVNCRAAHVLFCALWRGPSLQSLPTRAMGSALCVMGGWLRFLGHACSPYTCMGSALDVMDYGLAKAESSVKELTARTPLILRISPRFSPTAEQHVSLFVLWRRPSLRSLPTRAMGSALCVMGGRLWFLGHACSSYMCTGSTLDVMDYGLAKAKEFSNELTA